MFGCHQNDAEERGVWQTFSKSVEMRLKTQGKNDCQQAAYISMLSCPAFCSYLALELSYLYLSNTSRVAQVL